MSIILLETGFLLVAVEPGELMMHLSSLRDESVHTELNAH